VLRERDAVGGRELLHPLGEAHRVALCGVVHAQIVADLADDHLSRVETETEGEVDARVDAQLVGILAQAIAQRERRVAGALRVVLVGDRRAEERHDAVAGVMVHRALEAMNAVRKDLEEAVEDLVPLLRVELLGQLHRPLHVGEEDRHLLSLTLEGGLRLQDLIGEVLRGVGARRARRRRPFDDSRTALEAELRGGRQLGPAAGAARGEGGAAFEAELRSLGALATAARAVHAPISRARRSACPVAPMAR
jgi:hypothetical protein